MKPASLNCPPKPINANYWNPFLLHLDNERNAGRKIFGRKFKHFPGTELTFVFDFKRTVNDVKTPCRIWQHAAVADCSFLQGLFPLNRSESKKQMSFQDSPALVGLRGGSPRRVSWYKAILLRWDGLHLTLHFQCTSVHCTCWNWTPLPAQCPSEVCHTLCYRVLASDTVAVREAVFTTLSGELARSSAVPEH